MEYVVWLDFCYIHFEDDMYVKNVQNTGLMNALEKFNNAFIQNCVKRSWAYFMAKENYVVWAKESKLKFSGIM